jgi:hypothetical protein
VVTLLEVIIAAEAVARAGARRPEDGITAPAER